MYHIKQDRRTLRTAEEIVRGMMECLKEKPLSAVTVTDLHRKTGISRATFYRLFDTTEDVLEYIVAQYPAEDVAYLRAHPGKDAHEMFELMLELGLQRHDLLRAMVDNGRYDLVYRFAEQRLRLFESLHPGILPMTEDASYKYMISSLAMLMVSTMVTWVHRGRIDTPQQISAYTRQYMKTLMRLTEAGQLPGTGQAPPPAGK